uniref:Uncharacterized protein n=1 Tax=Lepeophtheirus salmonis TaxID=72036 RepID=A0A0K2VCR4_LEPSM
MIPRFLSSCHELP